MIIFHEGLPGSGKSYEAMIRHVIPALQAGRAVDLYVEGPDSTNPTCPCMAKIAEVAQIERADVYRLVQTFKREQVREIATRARDNAFVVIDEAQNFWPTGRQKLAPEMMQFVTEHRHRGLDILLMGQLMKDVHPIWRGRVDQKCVFNKLSAIGREGNYTVTVWKATSPEKFAKVTQSFGKYDAAKFGMYASHVSDAIQTSNYKDSRATVWGSAAMKYGIPLALVIAAIGFWQVWRFFHPAESPTAKALPASAAAPASVSGVQSNSAPPGVKPAPPQIAPGEFFAALSSYRPRVALLWQRGPSYVGLVEWWDGDQVRERLTLVELATMGVKVDVQGTLLRLNGKWVTAWPVPLARRTPYGADAPVTAGPVQTSTAQAAAR